MVLSDSFGLSVARTTVMEQPYNRSLYVGGLDKTLNKSKLIS